MDEFNFTQASLAEVDKIMAKYPPDRKRSAVIPLLQLAQRQHGWLPRGAIECVAGLVGVAPIRVLEVASFYTMFNLKPVGKYHVQVCSTTPCWLRGADKIMDACKKKLKISCKETTPDGLFTLSEVECLGACIDAPVIQVNDDYHERLTEESVTKLLEDLAKK